MSDFKNGNLSNNANLSNNRNMSNNANLREKINYKKNINLSDNTNSNKNKYSKINANASINTNKYMTLNKSGFYKKAIAVLLSVSLMASFFYFLIPPQQVLSQTAAITMTLKAGQGYMTANGSKFIINAPFVSGELYVEAKALVELLGGDITIKGKESTVEYRDNVFTFFTDKKNYKMNEKASSKLLFRGPVVKSGKLCYPVSVFKLVFNLKSETTKSGELKLILQDDGALSDLSFLTGVITKERIGNSYFGWSVKVPKGSTLNNNSFNSKAAQILNENNGIYIEVYVEVPLVPVTPEEYLKDMKDSISNTAGSTAGSAFEIVRKNNLKYIEATYINEYEEAVYKRVFFTDKFIYNISISSYFETNPAKIKGKKELAAIMESFKLESTLSGSTTQDISSVKDNLVKFEKTVYLPDYKKEKLWEINVPAEWDNIFAGNSQLTSRIGNGRKEYINISIELKKGVSALDRLKLQTEKYSRLFNPEAYTLLEKGTLKIKDYQANRLNYKVKINKIDYIYNDYIIETKEFFYVITQKVSEERYNKNSSFYQNILSTLKLYPTLKDLKDMVENDEFNVNKTKVSQNDNVTEQTNTSFLYKVSMPGYLFKYESGDKSLASFTESFSSMGMSIQCISGANGREQADPVDEFSLVKLAVDNQYSKLLEKSEAVINEIRYDVYRYRKEMAKQDSYQDFYFYIVKGKKYKYCIMTTIPDEFTSEYNRKTIQGMLDSFVFDIAVNGK